MSEFFVIPQVTMTEEGPAVTKTVSHKTPQLIHLQQGSLDGACGPYSLCMALIALGFEKHSKLSNLEQTRSSKKLFKVISDHSDALITEGTALNQMKKYAETYAKQGLKSEKITADLHGNSHEAKSGKQKNFIRVRDFVIESVFKCRPVVFGSAYHYSLVIGLGFEDEDARKRKEPRYLLLLDPDEPSPTMSPWNGLIDMAPKGNNWFGTGGCTFEDALALWKE